MGKKEDGRLQSHRTARMIRRLTQTANIYIGQVAGYFRKKFGRPEGRPASKRLLEIMQRKHYKRILSQKIRNSTAY
jgi:hypothetical protein